MCIQWNITQLQKGDSDTGYSMDGPGGHNVG